MDEKAANHAPEARWESLLRLSRAWRLEWNSSELLDRICREAAELLGVDAAGVFLLQEDELALRGRFPAKPAGGASNADGSDSEAYWREAAEKVVRSGRAICGHRLDEATNPDRVLGFVLCVPLAASHGVLGALYLESGRSGRALSRRDHEFAEMFGLQTAAAVEHLLLYQSAITDPLTGLFSHRYFQQQIDQELRRARRTGRPASLVLMDLDRFKELNDTCGHEAGNGLLTEVARILRQVLRATDVVAHFGGDEFEVLLPETDARRARQVAEKIRWRIGGLPALEGGPKVTATLGVAAYPENALDAQTLFLRADAALYRAKEAGRNRTARSEVVELAPADPAGERGERGAGPAAARPARPDRSAPGPGAAATVPDAPVREQVDGHEIVRRLGTGSSGEVLLVRQPELDREVALKRLHGAQPTKEQAEAFRREARITASLDHPGVIPIHTMGRDADGRCYYTMQHLRGSSLGEILEQRARGSAEHLRRYTPKLMLETLARVAETVAYAHARGVAHMDLNPWNIIIGEYGEAVVIDWGEGARSSVGRAPSGSGGRRKRRRPSGPALVPGSPRYMAPEQLPGTRKEAGTPVDVHSLGAILYEMLTGRAPYARESTREAVEALRRGAALPPEQVVPEDGVDPVLSALCMEALATDPARRPGARDFAERLGRYVRSEKEWEVIRFGPPSHPLLEAEWAQLLGHWQLRDGTWRSTSPAAKEGICLWRVPVPGDFRLAVEAWLEAPGELSLIGHGPACNAPASPDEAFYRVNPAAHNAVSAYEGYCFEFGAENQTCTKLARNGHDVLTIPGLAPEVGRRYRLEMEYQDGWLRCFIDGRQVIVHRELFPMTGSTIGFYAFQTGGCFRPLEVHRQNWGLQPAMRLADDLQRNGFHGPAIERYLQIADRNPHRLEGDEARLKIGMCLAAQGKAGEARSTFRSVQAGAMEPFAMAEDAIIDFTGHADGDPLHGLGLFEELARRFPDSPANVRLLEANVRVRRLEWHAGRRVFRRRHEDNLLACRRLTALAIGISPEPMQSHLKCWIELLNCLLSAGRYDEALESAAALRSRIHPSKLNTYPVNQALWCTAIIRNREDLMPGSPSEIGGHLASHHTGFLSMGDAWDNVPLHLAVRLGCPDAVWAELASQGPTAVFQDWPFSVPGLLLAAGRVDDMLARLAVPPVCREEYAVPALYRQVQALIQSGRQDLREAALAFVDRAERTATAPGTGPLFRRVRAMCAARQALEFERDPERAAAELAGLAAPTHDFLSRETVLLQTMLASLGVAGLPGPADAERSAETELAGTMLDLARMFLGKKPAVPGELWPQPLWRTEWRLWLALWLEARGERRAAAEIARPARDPRYGPTNNQPALEALLARLGG